MPDGSLWIGTGNNALLRYRNGTFEKIGGNLDLHNNSIRALLVDSGGVLWIGTDKGLTRLDRGRGATVFSGGWEANVHVLLEYPAGTVWVGANNGLHRFESGASFLLEARPRFYQTPWFAGLCLVLTSTAGVAFYQLRVRELRRSERRLAERVEERTAELRQEIEIRKRA